MRSSINQGSPRSDGRLPGSNRPVANHWLVMTIQLSALALVIGLVTATGVLGWRYHRVHANQVWLDKCNAQYEWHYQVPHIERQTWQRMQKSIAAWLGDATVSDFHSIKLAGELEDESLTGIRKLHHLQKLVLDSNLATDQTLENICQLRQLRSLTLAGKQFSFEGLLELRKLPNLRHLVLRNMSLTLAELAVLETAVPQANLRYNRNGTSHSYERQVVARYPRPEKRDERFVNEFAPLLGQAPAIAQQPAVEPTAMPTDDAYEPSISST